MDDEIESPRLSQYIDSNDNTKNEIDSLKRQLDETKKELQEISDDSETEALYTCFECGKAQG